MTIVRGILVDYSTVEKIAENLQSEIRKIEAEENANFISFVSVGPGTKINPNPTGPWDLEIHKQVFMAAFSVDNPVTE